MKILERHSQEEQEALKCWLSQLQPYLQLEALLDYLKTRREILLVPKKQEILHPLSMSLQWQWLRISTQQQERYCSLRVICRLYGHRLDLFH